MRVDAERLKDGIKALKKGLNPDECNKDYYIGFLSALSNVEGLVAGMEQGYKKCRDCKFLSDKKIDKRFHSCSCPTKEVRKASSLLHYPWERACKQFQEKGE